MDQLNSKISLKSIAWGGLSLRLIRNKQGIEIVDLRKMLTKTLTVLTDFDFMPKAYLTNLISS